MNTVNPTSYEAIIEFVAKNGRARPLELIEATGLSRSMIQRALVRLVEEKKIQRTGSGPHVYYLPVEPNKVERTVKVVGKEVLERNYLYVSPQGEMVRGLRGLETWAIQTKQDGDMETLANEYIRTRLEANNHVSENGWVDATEKVANTFEKTFFDKVYFRDFYSLPRFGKTRLGQMVMLGKNSGEKKLIGQVANECRGVVERLIALHEVKAIVYVPHSVPRKVQFNTVLAQALNVPLPEVSLRKSYLGLPVQQKSLSRLEDRIENARKTIHLESLRDRYSVVMVIDDAVGSGATMNEVARKLKDSGIAEQVVCFGVVGSMKGFDVLPVV